MGDCCRAQVTKLLRKSARGELSHIFAFAILDERQHNREPIQDGRGVWTDRIVSGTVSRVLCRIDIPACWYVMRITGSVQPMVGAA
jgi:hypothetical protein